MTRARATAPFSLPCPVCSLEASVQIGYEHSETEGVDVLPAESIVTAQCSHTGDILLYLSTDEGWRWACEQVEAYYAVRWT